MITAAMQLFQQLDLPRPYRKDAPDFIYNLLFCDVPNLFRTEPDKHWGGEVVFSNPPDFTGIARLAMDPNAESRARIMAFNMLRWHGKPVPPKILLGVVIEMPLVNGMDTLAVYVDGRVRYINQTGKLAIFERQPDAVVEKARQVIDAATVIVRNSGPWEKARLPPPQAPRVHISSLVSDGLYIGDGRFLDFVQDPWGAPVIRKGRELLEQIVIAVKAQPQGSKT